MYRQFVQVTTVRTDLTPQERRTSVMRVDYDPNKDWLVIERERGEAPLTCAILPLILSLRVDDQPILEADWDADKGVWMVKRPSKYMHFITGATVRIGSTGAIWRHWWAIGESGFKERLLAFYKASMLDKVNETVFGIPYFLAWAYSDDYNYRKSVAVMVRRYVFPLHHVIPNGFEVAADYNPPVTLVKVEDPHKIPV